MFVRVSMQVLPERVAPAAEQPRASAAQTAVNRPAVALIALRPALVAVLKLRKCRRSPQAAFSLGTPAARRTQRVVPPQGLEARFGSYAREQPAARAPKTLLTCSRPEKRANKAQPKLWAAGWASRLEMRAGHGSSLGGLPHCGSLRTCAP